MTGQFDPYHAWLGIPPRHQPPNHYRLLGVQAFESDADVIGNAADRQMGHLRTYQTGKHEALSQRLLNEIAAAKVCLLNPQKKASYDERLRGKPQRHAEPQQPRLAQTRPLPVPNSLSAEPSPTIVTNAASAPLVATSGSRNSGSPRPSRGKSAKPVWKSPWFIALACGMVPLSIIAAVVIAVNMAPRERQEVAVRKIETPDSETTKPIALSKGDKGNPVNGNPQKTPLVPELPAIDINEPSIKPTPPIVSQSDPPSKIADPAPLDKEPVQPKPKFPPPDAAAVRAARLEIAELFELDQLKTRLAKHTTAEELIKAAAEEKQNTPAHYAALCSSRDLAASAADIVAAFVAIDRLDAVYAIDAWAMKLHVVETCSRGLPQRALRSFIRLLTRMTQQTTADGRYEIASGMAKLATASARRTQNRDLIRETAAIAANAVRVEQEFRATIAPALAKLETSPDDPAANLIAGKHYCLNRAEWQVGLKMMTQSAHEKIKAASQFDLSRPADPRKQVVVGDAWYEVANSDKTFEGFHARAHYWYESALENLGGLTKLKVEKRMQETAKFAELFPSATKRPVVREMPRSKFSLQGIKVVLRNTVTEKKTGVKSHLGFAPDGLTMAVAHPHTVRIFDATTGEPKHYITDSAPALITSLAIAPDGNTISYGRSDGKFRLWDLTTNKMSLHLAGSGPLTSIVFSPDGKTLACTVSRERVVKIDVVLHKLRIGFPLHNGVDFGPLAYRSNKNMVAAGRADGSVRMFDFTTGKITGFVDPRRTASVLSIAFSHDGTILALGSADHSISLANPDDSNIFATLTGHKGAVLGLAFSPDGKILASVSADNTVKLWDVAGKKLWQTLEGHPSQQSGANSGSIAFSPDGRILASCGNYTLKIWAATRR